MSSRTGRAVLVACLVLGGYFAGAIVSAPQDGSGGLNCTVPHGVPTDGSVEVTAGLQALIDSTPDGGCIRLPAGVRYWVEGTLWIKGRMRLGIFAANTTVFARYPGSERKPGPDHTKGYYRSHVRIQ